VDEQENNDQLHAIHRSSTIGVSSLTLQESPILRREFIVMQITRDVRIGVNPSLCSSAVNSVGGINREWNMSRRRRLRDNYRHAIDNRRVPTGHFEFGRARNRESLAI